MRRDRLVLWVCLGLLAGCAWGAKWGSTAVSVNTIPVGDWSPLKLDIPFLIVDHVASRIADYGMGIENITESCSPKHPKDVSVRHGAMSVGLFGCGLHKQPPLFINSKRGIFSFPYPAHHRIGF